MSTHIAIVIRSGLKPLKPVLAAKPHTGENSYQTSTTLKSSSSLLLVLNRRRLLALRPLLALNLHHRFGACFNYFKILGDAFSLINNSSNCQIKIRNKKHKPVVV
jgi:hypothetical protein